jgi:hypothetical protein
MERKDIWIMALKITLFLNLSKISSSKFNKPTGLVQIFIKLFRKTLTTEHNYLYILIEVL